MRQVMAPIGSRRLLPSRQQPGRRPRRKTAATAIQQIPIHWNGKSKPYSIRPSYSWESIPVFGTLTVPAAAEHHVAKPTLTSCGVLARIVRYLLAPPIANPAQSEIE